MKRKHFPFIIASFLALSLIIPALPVNATVSPNVITHTQEEIRSRTEASGVSIDDTVTYSVKPVSTAPYNTGTLSSKTLDSTLRFMNNIRYVAGLNDISLDDQLNTEAQAAAFISGINGDLCHDNPPGHQG